MHKKLYLVSRYMGKEKTYHCFHFRGYYCGHYIRKVYVSCGNFDLGEEYILVLDSVKIENSLLLGQLVRFKKFPI
ncbi:MAG: hypothetical protein QF441_11990 [Bacteriovoracaceae bacterium]|nr:hypothetical protein [Halobacteriovoraceae bacterium]MDP7321326.1 hypothetical protein [Bacteriovoracaceae bacterium]